MMRSLKRLSVLVIAGGVLMLVFGAGSALAKPCWKKLIDDWYDGRIDGTYSYACYRAAIKNAPEDIRQYSDLPSQLNRRLQSARFVKKHGQVLVSSGGSGVRQDRAGRWRRRRGRPGLRLRRGSTGRTGA